MGYELRAFGDPRQLRGVMEERKRLIIGKVVKYSVVVGLAAGKVGYHFEGPTTALQRALPTESEPLFV